MDRFRECFYRPLLSSSMNFERWSRQGALDAAARAKAIYEKALDEYQQPPLDEAIREELEEYVKRRRAELGD
jgi:trimethylamine--corrinoid protein Co-methyltransferase